MDAVAAFAGTHSFASHFHVEHERSVSRHHLLNKLFNAMKIAEMPKYGISFFEKTLEKNQSFLTERDFIELASSYWCRKEHLNVMVKLRGTPILDGRLKLVISQQLLSMVVDSGSGISKIRSMLEQRRRDLNYDHEKIQDLEREFFNRNCRRRWWNHELPIRAFAESGWLTEEYAKLGLQRFSSFMIARCRAHQKHLVNAKWENLTELLSSHGATFQTFPTCLPDRIQEAYERGVCTYEFCSLSITEKNNLLHNILKLKLPEEIWSEIVVRMRYV